MGTSKAEDPLILHIPGRLGRYSLKIPVVSVAVCHSRNVLNSKQAAGVQVPPLAPLVAFGIRGSQKYTPIHEFQKLE